jgi:DNA-binding CsgD family transcriptional regulator
MNIWTLSDGGASRDVAQGVLVGMISHFGSAGFSVQGLKELNRAIAVGSWSVYRLFPRQPPVCYFSTSFNRRDTTAACFQVYQSRLYRQDRTFEALVRDPVSEPLKAVHLNAQEVSNPEHRRAIYERHHIRERLSVAEASADGSILSVNLYRHADQDQYRDGELQTFQRIAPALFALVKRQITLVEPVHVALPHSHGASFSYRQTLERLAPGIPGRELDVCTRLLKGLTHDGVAADLGISATTVKTYRNRAFARLGIHHNNELFALALQSATPGT